MRQPNDKHDCLLFDQPIYWGGCGGCVEVQEDNMDMQLFPKPFDLKEAEKACEQCRWCYVNND